MAYGGFGASGLDDGKEVLEGLLGLCLDAAVDEGHGGRVEGDAAGDVGDAVVHGGLGVGADGTRGVGGRYGLVGRGGHGAVAGVEWRTKQRQGTEGACEHSWWWWWCE